MASASNALFAVHVVGTMMRTRINCATELAGLVSVDPHDALRPRDCDRSDSSLPNVKMRETETPDTTHRIRNCFLLQSSCCSLILYPPSCISIALVACSTCRPTLFVTAGAGLSAHSPEL